jgi:solute carrier family 25 carnitine/acylcarnitine transporter 20/29
VSVGGGAIAGAIGVGVAFPFDSLKTKSQALVSCGEESSSMLKLMQRIFKDEGLSGFYGGVRGAMAGQALVKSVAFATNAFVLNKGFSIEQGNSASLVQLLIASAVAGAITSFVVNPVERVKILMQADANRYENEIEAVKEVTKNDGLFGLLFRGLESTMFREIPGYSLYFVVYSVLVQSAVGVSLGPLLGPLICGATAGCASWVPVYPFDVCKTFIQNCEGDTDGDLVAAVESGDIRDPSNPSTLDVARYLNRKFGPGVFYEGILPKMVRAGVNHAVTFFVFELITEYAQTVM